MLQMCIYIYDPSLSLSLADDTNFFLSCNRFFSASGVGSILHCDQFRAMLSPKTKLKCVADGSYLSARKLAFDETLYYNSKISFLNLCKKCSYLLFSDSPTIYHLCAFNWKDISWKEYTMPWLTYTQSLSLSPVLMYFFFIKQQVIKHTKEN